MIIVIGAGLAGLLTARDLRDAGREVMVLEGRDRVGGRTWSAPFPGTGQIVDLGAEWVGPRHRALLAEYARYGIELEPAAEATPVWVLDGQRFEEELPVADGEIEPVLRLLRDEARRLIELGPRAYEPFADESFAETLDRLGVGGRARQVLTTLTYALMGADPDQYATVALVRETAAFGGDPREALLGEMRRVRGGADLLARRVAAGLDVRFGQRVIAVEHGVVKTESASYQAEAVVVAVPLNVLASIAFEPALSDDIASLAAEGHAGHADKKWVRATGVPAGSVMFGRAPREAYVIGLENDVLVGAFELGEPARLAEFHDGAETGEVFGHDWTADPFARGTWLASRPGQWSRSKAFWRPYADVVFAGGDLAQEWAGWMEGAVLSAKAAARCCPAAPSAGR
ncbi:flavin monoamine oxidase family protein [Actinoplanes sp. CA-054009]